MSIFDIDGTMMVELYKAIDKAFIDYGVTSSMERMTIATLYALEKQQYVFAEMLPHYLNPETWKKLNQRYEK